MKMFKFALINFKGSVKSCVSLVVSLSVTIAVIYDFIAIIYSDNLTILGERNKDFVEMLVDAALFILGCFMFFFIWYATDTFLTRRKREMGIYIFMGLTNQKIGKLYAIEALMTGALSLIIGLSAGVALKELFQMILFALAETEIDISFEYRLMPVVKTIIIFSAVYLIFMLKGYLSILKSSILDLLSSSRQNEYVQQSSAVLIIKALLGIAVLSAGYYWSVDPDPYAILGVTVLVVAGTYMLFGGFIPVVFQTLAKNKRFLYQKQRCLWINSVIFRMRKNYRTYAIVCVLAVCAAAVLATGFAMKSRYVRITSSHNTYTFQILSSESTLENELTQVIENVCDIAVKNQNSILEVSERAAVVSYSEVQRLAKSTGLEFSLPEPSDRETIQLSHEVLLSMVLEDWGSIMIGEQEYKITDVLRTPYLGLFHTYVEFYVVNDAEYERLVTQHYGSLYYLYNYLLANPKADFAAADTALNEFKSKNKDNYYIGKIASNPNDDEDEWMRFIYSICCVMFLVFILASGAIMFMKLSNDAYEEKGRYLTMKKLGLDEGKLALSIKKELATAYILPFGVMSVSAFFAVNALGKMMYEKLWGIYGISVLVVFIIFAACYAVSVRAYVRNVG